MLVREVKGTGRIPPHRTDPPSQDRLNTDAVTGMSSNALELVGADDEGAIGGHRRLDALMQRCHIAIVTSTRLQLSERRRVAKR